MKPNMGSIDKILRIAMATIIAYLYYSGNITGGMALGLSIVAIIFAATSLIGYCPLYALVGINTCSAKERKQ